MSDLIRHPAGKAAHRLKQVGETSVCTSIIVAAELGYGCAEKGSRILLKNVEALLAEIPLLPFDIPADAADGGLRAELEVAGQPIGQNDLLIAAHACVIAAILVTANVDEFSRVRGLTVENWLV